MFLFVCTFQDDIWIWVASSLCPHCLWERKGVLLQSVFEVIGVVCLSSHWVPCIHLLLMSMAGAVVHLLSVWAGLVGEFLLTWSLFSFPWVFATSIRGLFIAPPSPSLLQHSHCGHLDFNSTRGLLHRSCFLVEWLVVDSFVYFLFVPRFAWKEKRLQSECRDVFYMYGKMQTIQNEIY